MCPQINTIAFIMLIFLTCLLGLVRLVCFKILSKSIVLWFSDSHKACLKYHGNPHFEDIFIL